jgi:hypothetical protein
MNKKNDNGGDSSGDPRHVLDAGIGAAAVATSESNFIPTPKVASMDHLQAHLNAKANSFDK